MATINELKWASLTATINEIKSPNQFLKRLLFSRHETKPTENLEIGLLTRGRQIAPFVLKNGEGIMVSGHGETFQTVEPTNIRIKRPFTPSELLYNRRPGTPIFSSGAAMQISAAQAHIARDMQGMADDITNSEEYLCALALQGTITYQVDPQASFQVTFPKPAGHTITLTTFWDDADPTLPEPEMNVLTAKRLIAEEHGLQVTHCILGSEAAESFLKLAKRQGLLDQRHVSAGTVTFNEQFTNDGAIFLGIFCGISFWEYSRQVSVNGNLTDLVRAKYAEFLAVTPAAEWTLYYGAIPDMKAFQAGRIQAERFSKSWEVEDPSAIMALAHSRPLPVPRRPGAVVSMKVVSG